MKKLIAEYKSNIETYDSIISGVNENLSKIRKGEYCMMSKNDLLDQRALANIQRQIYVQVIKDLEDYA